MSNYRIYAGDKKSLVFPIMGDGYVHLDYSKHIPKGPDGVQDNAGIEALEGDDDDDAKYGLWAHKSSFTIEGIVTPYDINGFGWQLGTDHNVGTPSIATQYDAGNLDLPFKNKHFSVAGNIDTGVAHRAAAYFSHEHVAYLAATLNSSATAVTISSLEDIVGGTLLRINNEQMIVTHVLQNYGIGTVLTVTRAANGTAAAAHAVNDLVYSDNRRNHKMTLFHNETCQFYLKNMTRTNMNQPAEYKIGCIMKGKDSNGNIRTITTESNSPVILAEKEYYGKTIEQPEGANHVFGSPVYLEAEDRVRYHKLIDTSNNQWYIERRNDNAVHSVGSGNVTFSASGNTITRAAGSWPSIVDNYIKIIGSAKNDGYYFVTTRTSTVLTLSTTDWATVNTTSLLTDETLNTSTISLHVYYDTQEFRLSFGDASANYHDNSLDLSPHLWMGKNLYAQINSSKTFSTSLEQKDPVYLGYIGDIFVDLSNNITEEIAMAACRLVKPIRTTTETTIYVDDARNLSVDDYLLNNTENMKITAINGNTLTVTRGSSPKLTSRAAFSSTTTGESAGANYIISPKEEFNFSRTLWKPMPKSLFNGIKLVDGSGDSITNSDNYGAHLLGDTWMEAAYVLRPFHLAMSYDNTANRISLFIDNKEVDTQIFSEGDLRIDTIVGTSSSAVATINTIDPHGLSANDWVSVVDSSVTNLDGVWTVASVTDDNTFTINCVNTVASATTTAGTLKDVTIRTTVNFQDLEFDATDCYLGSNGNTPLETRRGSQFMGELHEFAITKEAKDRFLTIDTLVPNYRNTLLYFRFEGENV